MQLLPETPYWSHLLDPAFQRSPTCMNPAQSPAGPGTRPVFRSNPIWGDEEKLKGPGSPPETEGNEAMVVLTSFSVP